VADEKQEAHCKPCNKDTRTAHWYAWLDLMPPTPDHLLVTGEVLVANPGVQPMLVVHEPQGINQRVLMLDLLLCQQPGMWPQILVWKPVKFRRTGRALRYDQVDILCGGQIIVSIPVEDIH